MQDYQAIPIAKNEIRPLAERMKKAGRSLVMIHAWLNKEEKCVVSWDYAVESAVESYQIVGETKLPSIGDIYDSAATWPERELNELFGLEFEGLDCSKRLFLPEDMLETQGRGQIMVTPLSELVKNVNQKGEET